ncbi:MAG: hypothetical protein Ct9H300mP16_17770 [Pseudomonadota bacterium]|nr:MAG: hypothetical protein Ct9H300mP16_17770 [Pseudomonadota bacterium]
MATRSIPCQCLEPSYSGCDSGFRHNPKKSDITGTFDVCAAAKFQRGLAHADHSHLVVIFLSKESRSTFLPRFVQRHDFGHHAVVGADLVVDPRFNSVQLVSVHSLVVRKIKPQSLGRDQ